MSCFLHFVERISMSVFDLLLCYLLIYFSPFIMCSFYYGSYFSIFDEKIHGLFLRPRLVTLLT